MELASGMSTNQGQTWSILTTSVGSSSSTSEGTAVPPCAVVPVLMLAMLVLEELSYQNESIYRSVGLLL